LCTNCLLVDLLLKVVLANGQTRYIYTRPTGDNGVVSVKVQMADVEEIWVTFPSGGAIADIDYTMCKLMETPAPTYSPECPDVVLDFNTILPGTYISDELWDEYGIKFSTESSNGGYRPNNAARVFDTTNPGNWTNGSPDIGSPNEACGGPGVGQGGVPGTLTSNCEPLGNALIVQADSKVTAPMYYKKDASKIKVYFKVPAWVSSITVIVGDGCKQVSVAVSIVELFAWHFSLLALTFTLHFHGIGLPRPVQEDYFLLTGTRTSQWCLPNSCGASQCCSHGDNYAEGWSSDGYYLHLVPHGYKGTYVSSGEIWH
jgi:hypothetical protein